MQRLGIPWLPLLLLLLLVRPAAPASWWVNFKAGDNSKSGTSAAAAWKDLKKARTVTGPTGIQPGDTINIVSGGYKVSDYQAVGDFPLWTEAHVKGMPGLPITIQPEPGGTVVIDGENVNSIWLSFYPSASSPTNYYIVVKGLEFTHWKGGIISIGNTNTASPGTQEAHYVAVTDLNIHDNYQGGAAALGTTNGGHVIFKNNRVVHTGDPARGWTGAGDHGYYISHGSQFVVIDGGYHEKIAGFTVHMNADFVQPWVTKNVIVRRVTSVNSNRGLSTTVASNYQNIMIYHNTSYGEQHTYPEISATTGYDSAQAGYSLHGGALSYSNVVFKNNIGDGWIDNAGGGQIYADTMFPSTAQLFLDYNLFHKQGTTGALYYMAGAYQTLPAFRGATAHGAHDIHADPLFVNPAAGTRNFALQTSPTPSPAIDAGDFLTTATNTASTASTLLTVNEPSYFHDGYGLVPGDTIQIGTQSPVLVTNVNYGTKELTLAQGRTWTAGQGVSLPYNGRKPDMGALETVGTGATQLQFTAPAQTTEVNQFLPTIVVEVRNASGTLVPDSTANVTLTLTAGPGVFPDVQTLATQTFTPAQTGRYVRLEALADPVGGPYTSAAETTVLAKSVGIPQAGMRVVSVSSEEAPAHAATKALDGTTRTYWYTQFTGDSPPHPHTLVLDLGTAYPVNGWTYLPFQDADNRGRITQYTFAVSPDGTNWGTPLTDPLLTGTLTRAAVGGVATFPALVFGRVASGYVFTATSPGLTSASSGPFAIVTNPPPCPCP
jgi:hypothetical protein